MHSFHKWRFTARFRHSQNCIPPEQPCILIASHTWQEKDIESICSGSSYMHNLPVYKLCLRAAV